MSSSLSRRIETSIVAKFAADSTIKTVCADVRHYHDQSRPRANLALIVRCLPAENLNTGPKGMGNVYRTRVEIMAAGRIAPDEDGAKVDALTSRVEAMAYAWAAGDLTVTGLTIDGITAEPPDEVYEDDLVGKLVVLTVHFQT